MTDFQPVNWNRLLEVYKHCLTHKLSNFANGLSVENSSYPSDIACAESIANPIAYLTENLVKSNSLKSDSTLNGTENGNIKIGHPVNGNIFEVPDIELIGKTIEDSISNLLKESDSKKNFLALWRLWPELTGASFLPTSLKTPDNPLVNSIDMTSGIWVSQQQGESGSSYFSFVLGPVQPFIESARSVRDLWTGSAILSWLVFQAMLPVLENFGPTAFVYPYLRRNPQLDIWLRRDMNISQIPETKSNFGRCPSIPHRFVAIVPRGENGNIGNELGKLCEQSAKNAWLNLADSVRNKLKPELTQLCRNWDRLWEYQIENVFEIRTSVVPVDHLTDKIIARLTTKGSIDEAWPELEEIRKVFKSIPVEETESSSNIANSIDQIGQWQLHMDYSARIMESMRSVRHFPKSKDVYDQNGQVPQKCSIYGYWEQMGPSELGESNKFWKDVAGSLGSSNLGGVRIRESEKFCAVALTKRFAAPVHLANAFAQQKEDLRFPDTATIAAFNWLGKVGIDSDVERKKNNRRWNGRWLHQDSRKHQQQGNNETNTDSHKDSDDLPSVELMDKIKSGWTKEGKPPSYYAILLMDGDNLGSWLSGKESPNLRDVLPPILQEHIPNKSESDENPDLVDSSNLELKRPVCPTTHSAISAALGNFATYLVPEIVQKNNGIVIYSGGDDLLALLPATNAVKCANELQMAYKYGAEESKGLGGMGNTAGITASITYVHYMEDLRFALRVARESEKDAKNCGRDIANLKFMKRSGGHSSALLPWGKAKWFEELTSLFERKAGNGWAYQLHSESLLDWIDEGSSAALDAEIRRIGNRVQDDIWKSHALHMDIGEVGEVFAKWWSEYQNEFNHRKQNGLESFSFRSKFEWFTLLSLGAAFVARGRDD